MLGVRGRSPTGVGGGGEAETQIQREGLLQQAGKPQKVPWFAPRGRMESEQQGALLPPSPRQLQEHLETDSLFADRALWAWGQPCSLQPL